VDVLRDRGSFGGRGNEGRVAAGGRVQAPSLRIGWSSGVHDNKSVAEIGKRHHLFEGRVVSAMKLAGSSRTPKTNALTRRVIDGL
jgi:hypothetical protein